MVAEEEAEQSGILTVITKIALIALSGTTK